MIEFLPIYVFGFVTFLRAGLQDLEMHKVADKIWIQGFLAVFLYTAAVSGPFVEMGFYAVLGAISGYVFQRFTSFGGADIFGLALITSVFPGIPFLRVLALVMVPALIYQKLYYRFTGVRAVPLIPGLGIGFLVTVVYAVVV